MKKRNLAQYLLLSFFVHASLLIGAYKFQRLPPEKTPVDLIPVEIIVLREEPLIPQLVPVMSEPKLTRKADETKSRVSMHRRMDSNMDDFAELSPKESHFEPSLNIDRFPVLNIVQKSRKGEKTGSKSMISIFQQPPVHLSPVNLSAPDRSPAIELEMPSVLSMAEIEEVQTYPRTLKKTGLPLKKTRADVDFVAEVQSIPNIESPSIPDHRKMVLAVPGDYSLEAVAGFETKVRHKSVLLPDVRVALKKESTDDLKPMIPVNEPAPFNLKILSFFSFLGSAKGAAYLFVVDTSGSIKGAPLEGIKKSAREFVSLMGENDRAGIMTFDDSSVLVAPFTSKKEPLREEIDKLRIAGNQTVLFDALMKANRFISKEDRQNRFIVLFSDGKDEGSQSTLDKLIKEIRRSGVSILSVGYSRVEREYLSIMRKLAEKTGGAFVNAPQFHDILTLYRASRDTHIEDSGAKTTIHALLKIKSHPIGAQVFVDGLSKGETPLDLALPFGTHEVRLTLPDYYDWEAQIELRKEGETPIHVRLLPVEEKIRPKKSLKKETYKTSKIIQSAIKRIEKKAEQAKPNTLTRAINNFPHPD